MNNNFSNINIMIIFFFGLSLWGAYSVYQTFLFPMVIAMLLTMATYNITKRLTKKFNSRVVSSIIATFLLILLIFVPILYITTAMIDYLTHIDKGVIGEATQYIKKILITIPYGNELSLEFFKDDEIITSIRSYASYLTSVSSAGVGFIKNILFVLVFYFIINVYGDKVFVLIQSLIPIPTIRSTKIISSVSSTMEVVFYSIIVTAIFEGLLFGFFISIYGFDGLLFGIIYGFASLIPVVGGAIVWLPLSIYAWNNISPEISIQIVSYSLIVISLVADTIIKPMIIRVVQKDMLKTVNDINELLIFFSIIAGMSSYGFWGMILGPAITSFLIAMTRIYIEINNPNQHLKNLTAKDDKRKLL
ncbi:Acid membrane antigen A [hydrothermal vent metagenome]|uniref:Acid membrane antigen A n=1 Tax=hydrothermal vent metagenome TaxID=652676 RepID=A0A1W1EL33_9ZZZZ